MMEKKRARAKDQDNVENELGSFQAKIEILEKDISSVEHEIEKVKEMAENENISNKVKLKVLDVEPEKSTENSDS